MPSGSPDRHLSVRGKNNQTPPTADLATLKSSRAAGATAKPYLGARLQAFQLLGFTEGFVVLKLVFNFVLGKEKLQAAFVAVINISLLKGKHKESLIGSQCIFS